MINVLLLAAGFAALIYGANILVDSASSLARRLNVPDMVIGLTIVAFGTSSPELVVNLFASLRHNSDMALGNVIGSNIFNILAILGISAVIRPLEVRNTTTWIEIPLSLLAALAVYFMAGDVLFDRADGNLISRVDGIILLLFFMVFMAYNVAVIKGNREEQKIEIRDYTVTKSVLLIIAGLVLLAVGGRMIVVSATDIARMIGISEKVIALTIVSVGTSLPELATSVVAARKKNLDIAIGNVVGSNIFNLFFILGISAVIYPVSIPGGLQLDLYFNILASLLLFIFVFTGRGRRLERWEGAIFLLLYTGFVTGLIIM
ncbi:MAG: calcium/sodium antiporter [Bacteroidales bacterium]|jgi:cation:H+ antiporter|nr:calcium/sodium antiporter [Bacteroidales bacterium]